MVSIFPSLISAPLLQLEDEIKLLEPYCAGFHLDVMDFQFVPNLTWGPAFINAIRQATSKQLIVHLMVDNPEKYIDRLQLNPADIIAIHLESPSTLTLTQLIQTIKSHNLIPSLAINPSTPIESLISLPIGLEHVLLMSVNPGFSGQKFIPRILDKLKTLNNFKKSHNLDFAIAVDGGIDETNIRQLVEHGANELAIASSIFAQKDHVKALKNLASLL